MHAVSTNQIADILHFKDKNNVATIESKQSSNKDLITRACWIGIMVPM